MDIEYKGANCIIISTKKSKIITDPKLSMVGLKDIVTKDAVEIATEARFSVASEDALLNIEGPGEYEVGDFSIKGVAAVRHIDTPEQGKQSTVYRIEVADIRIGLLGNIESKLTEEQLEALGVLDIVIIPVGGHGYTLDATSAAALVRSIDAKTVIPIHYADSGVKYEVEQDELSVFVKELSAEHEVVAGKFKVKTAGALPQTTTVVEITRS